jgi:uncharacterized protein (TIGR02145 family)
MVMDEQTYYFKGTSPFILKEANGTTHEIKQTSMPKANLTFVPVSITDKTECPGGLKEVIGVCPYTGTDWYADPNHKCQQRTSGAQNWEAWIKDVRDDELYRIVFMPDNKWWLAQNVKYAAKGIMFQNCGKDSCGQFYKSSEVFNGNYSVNTQFLCPPAWILPSVTQWDELVMSFAASWIEAAPHLRSLSQKCSPKLNTYGWATCGFSGQTNEPHDGDDWWAVYNDDCAYVLFNQGSGDNPNCPGHLFGLWDGWICDDTTYAPVRCLRQL